MHLELGIWRFPREVFLSSGGLPAAVLHLVLWCWAGIRRFMQGVGKKCRDELSFPWFFLLQRSWRVSCRAGRTSAWPCTRSCTGGPSATRWPGGCCSKSERGFLQSCWKHGAKSLLGWEWPCLVAFVVIIGGYQEAFPEIALQSQTWWRSQGESGSGLELLLFQAEFSNTLMQ